MKVNIENGEPLSGAVYALYSGTTPIGIADSSASGEVVFSNLSPGTYDLVETAPPLGFQPNTSRLPVIVSQDGNVTILGQNANGYRLTNTPAPSLLSEPPAINTVLEDAVEITGTGLTGCMVTVTFPAGETESTAVALDGNWRVSVPSPIALAVGNVVSAYQTCASLPPSNAVETTVVAEMTPAGAIDWENLTSSNGLIYAGDIILFQGSATNTGTSSSVWQFAVATVNLPVETSLVADSVMINGSPVTEGTGENHYTYDRAANTLTLYLGDIAVESSVPFSFRLIVSNELPDYSNDLTVDMTLRSPFRSIPPYVSSARPMRLSHTNGVNRITLLYTE